MKVMNLESEEEPVVKKKSKRNLKIALGLAAVILVPTIGSTLAGTITVGTGNTLEFAQGVTATTACDSTITLTPATSLTAGEFDLTTVAISALNNATGGGCAGMFFTLKVLNSSNTLVNITDAANSGVATQVKFQLPATCAVQAIIDTPNTDASVATSVCSTTVGVVTVTLATTVVSTGVSKITLESSST